MMVTLMPPSFVHGNYVATILLCQGLVEHLLAAYLHAGLLVDDIPDRIQFTDTLRRCREREVISDDDVTDRHPDGFSKSRASRTSKDHLKAMT